MGGHFAGRTVRGHLETYMNDADFMRLAIEAALEGIAAGQTPFGAAIVRAGQLVVATHNVVWATTDITAHAEVHAIREACTRLGTIDLNGCTIYSTTEPCPMCFSAIHWSKIGRIVYGASIADAAAAGFRELTISNEQMKKIGGSGVELVPGFMHEECMETFRRFRSGDKFRVY